MSLGCARCGACCDPVLVDFGVWARALEDARRYVPEEHEVTPRDQWLNCLFLAEHCRPVGVRGDQVMLECPFYDRQHRACRAYDRRPQLCSGFPWYGDNPASRAAAMNDSQCSYLLDVAPAERPEGARPLIPLMVLNGRAAA